MKQRLLTTLLLALLLLTLISVPLIQAQEPKPLPPELLAKIDPRLLKELAANNGSTIPIIIEMKAQADLTMDATLRVSDEVSRRATMVNALQATANASQVGVRAALIEANAREVRSLWIVNAVAAQTTLTTALQLAARDDVAQIRPDEIITLPPFTITEVAAPLSDTLQWGVEKIEANAVWQSLGIDGDGVVVANIDTGVDFLHPDLQKRYRGYQSAVLPPLHTGNWYDATGEGAIYPVDTNGHGTHTMGTTAGENGIGVAPGARWIAVRAFNSSGQAMESWLHDAFQWILTPEGDPALAPDVVNNSWGSNSGSSAEFEDDVQLLLDAGIIPIFSAGNSGPNSGTVGSPGSYSFAVGATDSDDVIASFSSRGPSPWGEIKPDVSAPGVNILSSLPGGGYGVYNGTSMAAPHVSGLTALLLQADDSLSYPQLTRLLTETALSLGGSSPNNTYGWGRVDAYNALQTALNAGQLVGTVSDKNTAQAIAGAEILITPRHTGYTNTAATNAEGFYRRGVAENDYNLSASAFAYQTQNRQSVIVTAGSVVTEDFELLPLPTGV
ncbi:MAG TPA: S8 family serine peptidase, partial [Chloroflexi bacterium]|nr:S8 family serine peptidase [Chloroflexota bacterium]